MKMTVWTSRERRRREADLVGLQPDAPATFLGLPRAGARQAKRSRLVLRENQAFVLGGRRAGCFYPRTECGLDGGRPGTTGDHRGPPGTFSFGRFSTVSAGIRTVCPGKRARPSPTALGRAPPRESAACGPRLALRAGVELVDLLVSNGFRWKSDRVSAPKCQAFTHGPGEGSPTGERRLWAAAGTARGRRACRSARFERFSLEIGPCVQSMDRDSGLGSTRG